MTHVLYFAYGSNMSLPRLKARAPSAERLESATLRDHRLAFHKRGTVDGSGKCDIVIASGARVFGVVFKLPIAELDALDAHEGPGYRRVSIEVELSSGTLISAKTYRAVLTDSSLRPFPWYVRHVLEGARQAGLPDTYIAEIETIETVDDPDALRERRELAVYLT